VQSSNRSRALRDSRWEGGGGGGSLSAAGEERRPVEGQRRRELVGMAPPKEVGVGDRCEQPRGSAGEVESAARGAGGLGGGKR
jgi:hypothetical protein